MSKHKLLLQRLSTYTARHPNGIIGGCSLFVLIMLALLALMLLQERQASVERTVENAENLELVVERDIARTAELFDLSLQAVADGVQDAGVMQLPEPYRSQLLFDRSATAGTNMGELLYLNAQGTVEISSRPTDQTTRRRPDLSQRDWFTVQRDNPKQGLFISAPESRWWSEPTSQPEQIMVFSRRVSRADGSFAGVVAGTLHLNYFRALLTGLKIGSHGSITLIHRDGTIIMRNPGMAKLAARNLRGSPNFERFRKHSERWFLGDSALDGVARLYVYRQFHDLPLVLSVAPALSDVYAAWNQRAWRIAAFAIFLSALLIGAAWLLSTQFKYRLRIEAVLLQQSRTDSLTGLNNRRTLDQALQTEWRRAVRTRQALALLFIDIDHFKAYNDRYGHQAGDATLAAVARALGNASQRPGDLMARFGGEEFVALLPDTDLNGAAEIARKIHAAIRALNIPHLASQHAQITVSIGVTCHPAGAGSTSPPATADALLKAADQALYAAKAGGRNQTAFAPVSH